MKQREGLASLGPPPALPMVRGPLGCRCCSLLLLWVPPCRQGLLVNILYPLTIYRVLHVAGQPFANAADVFPPFLG